VAHAILRVATQVLASKSSSGGQMVTVGFFSEIAVRKQSSPVPSVRTVEVRRLVGRTYELSSVMSRLQMYSLFQIRWRCDAFLIPVDEEKR